MFSTLKLKKIRFTIEIIIRLGSLEMHNTRYLVSLYGSYSRDWNHRDSRNITSFRDPSTLLPSTPTIKLSLNHCSL
jgi:hypothetical protein